eukprot:1187665-Prorocentrum_minimum.AAC.2
MLDAWDRAEKAMVSAEAMLTEGGSRRGRYIPNNMPTTNVPGELPALALCMQTREHATSEIYILFARTLQFEAGLLQFTAVMSSTWKPRN